MLNLTLGRSTQLKQHPGLYKDAEGIYLIDQRLINRYNPFLTLPTLNSLVRNENFPCQALKFVINTLVLALHSGFNTLPRSGATGCQIIIG
jgi:hypothetical protein